MFCFKFEFLRGDVGCGVVINASLATYMHCSNRRILLRVQCLKSHTWPVLRLPEGPTDSSWSQQQLISIRSRFLNQKSLKPVPFWGGSWFSVIPFINLDNPFMIRWHLFPNSPAERVTTIHYCTGLHALLLQLKIMLPLAGIIFMSLCPASVSRHHKSS